jgi:cell division initiation protein
MFTLNELKKITFSKSTMGGYKTQEVDDFMTDIVGDYAALLSERNELAKRITELSDKLDEYKKEEDNIKDALLTAQQLHNQTVKTAEKEAEEIRTETKNKVEELLESAKSKATEILESAKTEANSLIEGTKLQCEKEEKRYEVMKNMVGKFRNEMLQNYKTHIELLQNLPEYEEEEKKEEVKDEMEDISSNREDIVTEQPVAEEPKKIKIEDVVENIDTDDDNSDYVEETDDGEVEDNRDIIAEVSKETIVFSKVDIKDDISSGRDDIDADSNSKFEDIEEAEDIITTPEKGVKKSMAEKFAEIGELDDEDERRGFFGRKSKKDESKKIIKEIEDESQEIKAQIEDIFDEDNDDIQKVDYEDRYDDNYGEEDYDEDYSEGFNVNLSSVEDEESDEENYSFFNGN